VWAVLAGIDPCRRGTEHCEVNLRPYQERAISDLRAQYQAGKRAPVLVLPTGAGKTVVAAEIIRASIARGNRVLFLVHRQELLTQSVNKLESAGVTDLRIIQAGGSLGSPTAPVTVASIPTLTRWTERQPAADLVIVDESHHVVAKTWKRLADHYSASLLLGLTATPQRADGKPLGDIFDSIVVGATVRELTDLGHLVPCRVYAPPQELETGKMALDPVEAYQKHGEGQRAVVFCVTVEHAEKCAENMNAAGIRTGIIHGKLSADTRKQTLAALDSGSLDAITSCHVLTEGWDSPRVAVCILARKPQHTGLYLQMAGRVLRPSPGKTHATLIDLCGSVHDHGPPDLEREYSLGGKGISKPDRDLIRQCPACGGVFRAGPLMCPLCGAELPSRKIVLPESCGIGVIELDKLPKLLPRSVTLSISAKFASKCRLCGVRIAVGQQIYWNPAEKGARHADCREAVAA
jgi:DNA repair protein RadD